MSTEDLNIVLNVGLFALLAIFAIGGILDIVDYFKSRSREKDLIRLRNVYSHGVELRNYLANATSYDTDDVRMIEEVERKLIELVGRLYPELVINIETLNRVPSRMHETAFPILNTKTRSEIARIVFLSERLFRVGSLLGYHNEAVINELGSIVNEQRNNSTINGRSESSTLQ